MPPNRATADDWYPTIIRFGGIVLTFVLVVLSVLGHAAEVAPGWIPATMMFLYKGLHDAARPPEEANGDAT